MQFSEQTKQKVSEKKKERKEKREIDGKTRGGGPLFILRLSLSSSLVGYLVISIRSVSKKTNKSCLCTRLKYIVVMSITINTNPHR